MCERRGELSGGSPAGRKRKLKVQLERGRAPKSHDDKLRLPQRSNGVHECGVPFVGARRRRRSGGAAAVSSRVSSHMQREWMVQLVECREPLRRVRRAPSTMCAGSALRRCRRLHRCQRRASEQCRCPNERAACTPSSSAANPALRVQPASAAPDPRRDCPETWRTFAFAVCHVAETWPRRTTGTVRLRSQGSKHLQTRWCWLHCSHLRSALGGFTYR